MHPRSASHVNAECARVECGCETLNPLSRHGAGRNWGVMDNWHIALAIAITGPLTVLLWILLGRMQSARWEVWNERVETFTNIRFDHWIILLACWGTFGVPVLVVILVLRLIF